MDNTEKSRFEEGSDFEREFRQKLNSNSNDIANDKGVDSNLVKKNELVSYKKWVLVALVVLMVLGIIAIVVLLIDYLNRERELEEEEMEINVALEEGGDDANSFKDLNFSDDDSNAPLLVYAAVKNGEIVSANWLEEFKGASERYAEKYGRKSIPGGALFGDVTVLSGLKTGLYPNMDIERFLLETSLGCARFDFYEDLLAIYDYEFLEENCTEAEWDFLDNQEQISD